MAKRKVNVVFDDSKHYSDDSKTSKEYDSENDEPVSKRIRRNKSRSITRFEDTEESNDKESIPRENGEHSYSCVPLFNNVSKNNKKYKINENNNFSDGLYDSDDHNGKYSYGRRISERSTSPESFKSRKGKSMFEFNSQNFNTKRRAKCFTKNAVMARMNRQRKKEYLTNLEENVESLKESNNDLKTKLNSQQDVINSLKNEVKYLKSVISNSKEIGVLLRRICCGKSDMRITSSVLNTQSSQNEGIDSSDDIQKDVSDLEWSFSPSYDVSEMDKILQCDIPPTALTDLESGSGPFGVCLHVANKQVSLEFCASCNQSASSVLNGDIYSSVK